jgi:hypothetical protein
MYSTACKRMPQDDEFECRQISVLPVAFDPTYLDMHSLLTAAKTPVESLDAVDTMSSRRRYSRRALAAGHGHGY